MKITIPHARKLSQQPGVLILWRPEMQLPECEQYAVLKSAGKAKA